MKQASVLAMKQASLLAMILAALGGCSHPAPAPNPMAVAVAAAPAVYVDVRTPQEYAAGHVAGAVNIPYDQMAARWTELAQFRNRPLVLYCRSGKRAGVALEVLREKGFTAASSGGGLDDLRKQGVPLAK